MAIERSYLLSSVAIVHAEERSVFVKAQHCGVRVL
jgi:hypothetical protein